MPRLVHWGRVYFAIQAAAGCLWWIGVFRSPAVRRATLGGLDPVLVAVFDVPLFVVATAGSLTAGCLVLLGRVLQSWLVVSYAVLGSLVWNYAVRPLEEADLAERFGEEFQQYRETVKCWIPTFPGAGYSTAANRRSVRG